MNHLDATLAELQASRMAAQQTVDDCDAGMVAIRRLLGAPSVDTPSKPVRRKASTTLKQAVRKAAGKPVGRQPSAASEGRRVAILELVKRGPVTFGELVRKLPKDNAITSDQHVTSVRNTLQRMKSAEQIRRAGQNWIAA